ncbi:MAG TPA: PAS domain S-box protein, partial [Spirochaetota bacterium]|nr:PAS domain S-box protein [Spirochaetota bacterium]
MLNSYHYGFTWTDFEMHGIDSVIRKSEDPVLVQVEYLDAKRFTSATVNRRFRELLGAKTAGVPIRVIITTDNIALETALSVRPLFFPDAAIVFCGFNGNPDPVIAGKTNVTGIMEKWNPRGTLDAIASLQPGVRKLVVIHDQTESGLGTRDDFIDVISGYERKYDVRYLTGMRVEVMLDVISRLEADSAVVLLGFNMDSAGKVFDSASTGGLFASRSSVPVYTVDETRFNGGVVGGRLLTGERQGEIAARMALKIITGTRADDIPIVRNDPGVFIFAYDAMKKFSLSQKMLPAGSVVRNRPESIYNRYRTQVWAVTIVFIALIAFIIVLAYNVFRRKKVEEDRKRLVSAIEEADDMFCFSSVDEKVLYMNAAGMKTLGWKPEEIEKGLKSLEYIHPDHVTDKLHDVVYHELMKSGKWKGESAVCAADGREIPVSQVITMHPDENGKPQYFSSIIRDISEQKRNEEVLRSSEENLRITLDSIGDAVIATDEKGIVRRINPA